MVPACRSFSSTQRSKQGILYRTKQSIVKILHTVQDIVGHPIYTGQSRAFYTGQSRTSYTGQSRASYTGQSRASYTGQSRASYTGQRRAFYTGHMQQDILYRSKQSILYRTKKGILYRTQQGIQYTGQRKTSYTVLIQDKGHPIYKTEKVFDTDTVLHVGNPVQVKAEHPTTVIISGPSHDIVRYFTQVIVYRSEQGTLYCTDHMQKCIHRGDMSAEYCAFIRVVSKCALYRQAIGGIARSM